MTGSVQDIVAAMAAAARLVPFAGGGTWYDALFAAGPDGRAALREPAAPDRALLAALAAEYAELDAHLATLPDRTHAAWLQEILGIPRLPVLPDRVVAHCTVDAKLAPAVVPSGTILRGGKDAFGNERRYATLDPLTAHGAAVTGVRSLVPGGHGRGKPGIAAAAPDFPLIPASGPDAGHSMRIHSPALAFDGGHLRARLTFGGATAVQTLDGALWRCSRADGTVSDTIAGVVAGNTVTVTLTDGCGGAPPWIECVIPADVPVPESFAFSSVTVAVVARSPFVPQAAFLNDGAVDITKEFQPFGAVAKRGDAFYVRSDEAFGKHVALVIIRVATMRAGGVEVSPSAGGSGVPGATIVYVQDQLARAKEKLGAGYAAIRQELDDIAGVVAGRGDASVRWQRRVDGRWVPFAIDTGHFGSIVSDEFGSAAASEPFTVAGQRGHYVRAFLAEGDFGWTAYQESIADFATKAIAGTRPAPRMQPPPVPPVASILTIEYTTAPVAADRVESASGWRRLRMPPGGTFRPFRRAVSDTGASGMLAVGLQLPDTALGSGVSLYLDVDPAASCGGSGPVDASWQWWDGSAWRDLAVADASRQLREPGLLRFVAPLGWPVGCPDTGATAGRWVRLVTFAPKRLGDLRGIVVDAVLAGFVSGAADPEQDPSPATALPPGTIKGTLTPVRGVKKVTNLASVRGRGPEADDAYRPRASARVRHRDRALQPWDYESQVALAFPEVAAVRCLPHTGDDGRRRPGSVGLVVVPDRPLDPAPLPSVSLAERIVDALAPARPVGARVAVLCPLYAPVTVVATARLRPGVAALTGTAALSAALEAALHPAGAAAPGTAAVRWGRSLYASTLIALLEQQPVVDVITHFELRDEGGTAVEWVEVDACRGLYCSSAAHVLTCEEQL